MSEMIKIRKPKKDTVHWVFGIDVLNKDEFEAPKHLADSFKEFGYEVFEEKKEKEIVNDSVINNRTVEIKKGNKK